MLAENRRIHDKNRGGNKEKERVQPDTDIYPEFECPFPKYLNGSLVIENRFYLISPYTVHCININACRNIDRY